MTDPSDSGANESDPISGTDSHYCEIRFADLPEGVGSSICPTCRGNLPPVDPSGPRLTCWKPGCCGDSATPSSSTPLPTPCPGHCPEWKPIATPSPSAFLSAPTSAVLTSLPATTTRPSKKNSVFPSAPPRAAEDGNDAPHQNESPQDDVEDHDGCPHCVPSRPTVRHHPVPGRQFFPIPTAPSAPFPPSFTIPTAPAVVPQHGRAGAGNKNVGHQ